MAKLFANVLGIFSLIADTSKDFLEIINPPLNK